jgi:putative PEP-CTERM system histidine kinase
METSIYFSYWSSSLAYSILFLFAILRKERNWAFLLSVFMSIVWSANIIRSLEDELFFVSDTIIYETFRNLAWFLLIQNLFPQEKPNIFLIFQRFNGLGIALGIFLILTISIEAFPSLLDNAMTWLNSDPRIITHVMLAVLGLVFTEQLYRNCSLEHRWHLKFICLSLGSIFAVDFLVYSKSLLYKHLDFDLWQTRGFLNTIITPFLGIGIHRLQSLQNTSIATAPRKIVFYTSILFGCGIYLILMSATGYYLKQVNAEWGETIQTVFIFLAMLLLIITFTSGKIRALAKVYFSKHFFHYNYDYRDEWLKISKSLAKLESLDELKDFIIITLSNLVESSGGGLWLKNDHGQFFLAAQQNLRLTAQELEQLKTGQDLPDYLLRKQWVIDFFELAHAPEVYDDIDLSPWCYKDSQVWLIVPLFHLNHLEAFVVLTQPRAPRKLNWEDHDLLKTVGMQLANALALTKASEALANNRQFEAYHRLSAFLVHDLKNITAQISLIVKNAEKHKHNQEFFDDTIETLNHVVNKMQHIANQLRQGNNYLSPAKLVNLVEIIKSIQSRHKSLPLLQIENQLVECFVKADPTKLINILTNLVQNAQDASQQTNCWVRLVLTTRQDYAVIKIIDNGTGMTPSFISDRLFKPFDTTKGNAGMGIGAYEAKDYILKIGGKLDVESQPNHGTTFTIQLPITKPNGNE